MNPITLIATLAAALLAGVLVSGCSGTMGEGDPQKGASTGPQPSSKDGGLPTPESAAAKKAAGQSAPSGSAFGR